MKKSIFFSLIFSILLIVGAWFAAPSFYISAAGDDALVQCGRLGGPLCDMCDLIVLVKNVLDFIWKGAWVIAAGMMVYGGFYMILPSFGAGGAGMYQKGISILTNVAKGLVIVFFAWIVIDTIIKVVASQSLTSGAPATLPQSTNTTTFNSQATPDFGEVPGEITVPRFTFKLGPWNKISCTRAPERAPLALLEIPEEFKCKPGQPSAIPGFDPCDPIVKQSIQDYWLSDKTTSFAGSAVAGKCKPGILRSYSQQIQTAATANGVPLNCAHALFITESGGSSTAQSNKGAAGLGQIMPSTARTLDPQQFRGMSDEQIRAVLKSNPDLNIQMSMRYFGSILRSPLGKNDCLLAAAGYNAGPDRLNAPRRGSSCVQQYIWQCIPETRDIMVPSVRGNLQQIAAGCNPT